MASSEHGASQSLAPGYTPEAGPPRRQLVHDLDFYALLVQIARDRLDLTQAALAAKLGVSQQCAARYETGERRIPAARLLRLLRLLKQAGELPSLVDWIVDPERLAESMPTPAGPTVSFVRPPVLTAERRDATPPDLRDQEEPRTGHATPSEDKRDGWRSPWDMRPPADPRDHVAARGRNLIREK